MSLSRLLCACLLSLALWQTVSVAAAQGPRATLTRVRGTVRVMRANTRQWATVRQSRQLLLYAGDQVQALQRSRATILVDGARVELEPGAHITITAARANRTERGYPSLLAVMGRVFVWLASSAGFELGAEGVVAGAGGTQFVFEVSAEGVTTVTVLEGSVYLYNDLGRVVIQAGEQSQISKDIPPTRPRQVDVSGYLEWEGTLENLWLGWETRYTPGATREALQQAASAAVQAADRTPTDTTLQLRAGEALQDLGDLKAAEERYRKALESSAGDPAVLLHLGYCLLELGLPDEANATFAQALTAVPGEPEAELGQVLALMASGDPSRVAEARASLGQFVTRHPEHGRGHLAAALLAIRSGDATGAQTALAQALRLDPGSYHALAYQSGLALARGDAAAARTAAEQAVAAAPASALAQQSLAAVLFYAGDLEGAAGAVRTALAANPLSAMAHLLAADVALASGDLEGGAAEAEMSVALDPTLAPALSTLGMARLARNELPAAESAFARALQASPQLVAAQTGLGATYLRQGRLDEALRAQAAALAWDRDAVSTHNNLGAAYLAAGRLEEAYAQFAEAIRLQPDSAIAHANLALAALELNRFAEAVAEGEKAVRLGDRSARLRTTLGRVYLKQNRVLQAWAVLRQARELDPDYALADLYLAEVNSRLGRSRDAVRETLVGVSKQPSAALDDREYARTIVRAAAGDDTLIRARTDGRGARGQNSYYLAAEHRESDWDGTHSDYRETTALGIVGRQTAFQRTDVLVASGQWDKRDRPGTSAAAGTVGDGDYHTTFRGVDAHYLARRPVSDGVVTLRLGYRDTDSDDHNPDSLDPDPKPYRHISLDYHGPMVEVRLDRPSTGGARLVAGAVISDQIRQISGLIGTRNPAGSDPPARFVPFGDDLDRQVGSFYVDYGWPLADKTRLVLGTRGAVADDMSPVWRPRLTLRHALGPDSTLLLLSWPVLSDDVSEISPVEEWALADPLSPLDLARGGYSQSHEAQYQRLTPGRSLVRVGVFHRDLRNLLIDLEDPARSAGVAPTVIGSGYVRGIKLEAERRLGRDVTGGLTVAWQDSRNDATGRDLPYQPELTGSLRLDYLSYSGWRGEVAMDCVGRRYSDPGATVRLDSTQLWRLTLAKQHSIQADFFLTILNLFDEDTGFWRGYPASGRRVSGGVEYRF